MLSPPNIDPVAVRIGPLAVHWYGLMYLLAFALFWLLARLRLRHEPFASATPPWTRESVEDLLFWGVLGVVLGGRLGYCLFYQPGYYAAHPLKVLA
ncbi:MAG: prolipoprotein diacylglyceryl transferase [Ottowia sp.]|nr:prolipoprotein diacylglyceryl transferase [Ottowia sp.]